jgi:hypothetical protein
MMTENGSGRKPRCRFPSLVLPSSGSEGLLSAVLFRLIGTGCTPNGTIEHMMKKNHFNIQGHRDLVKRRGDYLTALLACHSFFAYFLQHTRDQEGFSQPATRYQDFIPGTTADRTLSGANP